MLLSALVAQMYLKGNYWLSWDPEIIKYQTLSLNGTSELQKIKMDTTVFHTENGEDVSTVNITIPVTVLQFITNTRFPERCMKATKLVFPLLKVLAILSRTSNAS